MPHYVLREIERSLERPRRQGLLEAIRTSLFSTESGNSRQDRCGGRLQSRNAPARGRKTSSTCNSSPSRDDGQLDGIAGQFQSKRFAERALGGNRPVIDGDDEIAAPGNDVIAEDDFFAGAAQTLLGSDRALRDGRNEMSGGKAASTLG